MGEPLRDDELIRRIALRDADALALLYDRCERPVFALALHIVQDVQEAEAVVRELFVLIWNNAGRIRTDQGAGRSGAWIMAAARELAIGRLSGPEEHAGERPAFELPDWPEGTGTWADIAGQRIQGEEMKEALNELNADQRQALEWICFRGCTQQEVADLAKIPLGMVKSRVRLALQRLRRRYDAARKEEIRE